MSNMQKVESEVKLAGELAMPFLPPNVQLAWSLAMAAMNAIDASMASGKDITDGQLSLLFAADDTAAQIDVRAREARAAKVDIPT